MNFLNQYKGNKKAAFLRLLGRVGLTLAMVFGVGGSLFAVEPPKEPAGDVSISTEDFFWVKVIGVCMIIIVLFLAWIALVVSVKDPAKISLRALMDEFTSKNLAAPEMHHEYDGIRELDNPMPAWLRLGFIFSIFFGFAYMIYYHFSGVGPSSAQEYEEEVRWAEMTFKDVDLPDDALKIVTDGAALSAAQGKFDELCAPCHLKDMGGDVGPNLTDEYWLHGGGIKEVYNTITVGVPEKGMISWKKFLTSKERLAVASYILSMQGSSPAKPKAPQGVKWTEGGASTETAPMEGDSTAADTSAAVEPVPQH